MARGAITAAILIAAVALVVQGSFRRASPLETPSSLLAHRGLWGSPIRLVGVVRSGSVEARANGMRFVVTDERGTKRMIVHYAGDTPNALRGGRLIEVTGTFAGRAFEAQPSTMAVICGRTDPQQHC
jgi:cytochrome c-type biogenesis protein CcmE